MVRNGFKVDSLEKAQSILSLMRFHRAADRIDGLFALFPETHLCTHEEIGALVGLTRESVSRAIGSLRKAAMSEDSLNITIRLSRTSTGIKVDRVALSTALYKLPNKLEALAIGCRGLLKFMEALKK